MVANQRLRASDGYEVLLFPLAYMYISQDEGESYSHAGTLNIDFLGWNSSGRVYNCPYYAPCTCTLVYQSQAGAYNIWNSVDLVHTPSGLMKVCFMVIHDSNLPYSVGTTLNQGDLLGHTGTGGQASGDHLHLNVASGGYAGQEQVPPDYQWQLINSKHIYNMMYVNDTTIVYGANHPWTTYNGGISSGIKNKFPWVLYSRKLRNKRRM